MHLPGTVKTHNDTSNSLGWIAVALQVLGNCDENTGGKGHVKDPVRFATTLLNLFQVLSELDKGIVLVVLAGDVGAEAAELFQLLLEFFCGCLDVGLHTTKIFLVVHLCPGISHNLDIFWEEVVSVLPNAR